ncbi:hypothetical protein, partial [Streptomyces sp. IBSBF 2390]|uniref:hypothetical protein n=1 Tax=Streptomyces sp. IBSBF 2390 TaxID=2903533 RepID=UPI002FDBEE95
YNLVYCKGEVDNRSSILIKSNINFLFVDGLSDEDLTVINVKLGSYGYLIASAYLGIKAAIPSLKLKKLVERNNPQLVGSDANAHNLNWGSKETNERGECLMNFIIHNNLVVHNRG